MEAPILRAVFFVRRAMYPKEFREKAVSRVRSGEKATLVAADIEVSYTTLVSWCSKAGVKVRSNRRRTKAADSKKYRMRMRACLSESLSQYPEFITTGDFAKIFNISRTQIYRLIEQEKLLAVKLGDSYRIPKQELIDRLSGTSSNDALIG